MGWREVELAVNPTDKRDKSDKSPSQTPAVSSVPFVTGVNQKNESGKVGPSEPNIETPAVPNTATLEVVKFILASLESERSGGEPMDLNSLETL